jgi:hypothetical protein
LTQSVRELRVFESEFWTPEAADDLNLACHRLDTWPDIVPGFVRPKR